MNDQRPTSASADEAPTPSLLAEVAVDLTTQAASAGARLCLGLASVVAAGGVVWFLGDRSGHWWPWAGLLVLASGALLARLRWRSLRYVVALAAGLAGAAGNLLLGTTTPTALGVAAAAALVAVTALLWSVTEAFLTS